MLQILDLFKGPFSDVFRRIIATKFSENEDGGGSKAVWNFSENLSVFVGSSVPKFEEPGKRQNDLILKLQKLPHLLFDSWLIRRENGEKLTTSPKPTKGCLT